MNFFSVILTTTIACSLISLSCAETLAGTRPNIIVVMTDDQGYGDLSCHGHPFIKTPNIDALRDQSMRFEDFHVSPTCAPSRAGIMAGVHPFKVGVTHTIFHREKMALDRKILPQVMKSAGYSTGLFGKWHLGDDDPFQPHMRGFDEVLIHGSGLAGASGIRSNNSCNDMILRHNGTFVQSRGYCTDVFFGHAMEWMKKEHDAGRPFLSCIFTNAPHAPWVVPEKYAKEYAELNENPAAMGKAGFFAMIRNVDDNMGLLMERLEEWEMTEETILIFMTDNGSVAGSVYNAGMKGGKNSIYEGGSRVPFFIRWPGRLEAGKEVETLTRHFDLLPTFAALAGAETHNLELDGKSLLPLMQNPEADWEERTFFFHKGRWGNPAAKQEKHRVNPGADNNKENTFAVRDETWRLTVNKSLKKDLMLHEIMKDYGEETDLSENEPERVEKMLEDYRHWWDTCRPLMSNEDADLNAPDRHWPGYLSAQKAESGTLKELIPHGVETGVKVVNMSPEK